MQNCVVIQKILCLYNDFNEIALKLVKHLRYFEDWKCFIPIICHRIYIFRFNLTYKLLFYIQCSFLFLLSTSTLTVFYFSCLSIFHFHIRMHSEYQQEVSMSKAFKFSLGLLLPCCFPEDKHSTFSVISHSLFTLML